MKHILQLLIKGLIGFTVGVIIYFMLLLTWWQVFPYRTADIVEPLAVLNEEKVVNIGEKLRLTFMFTKYTNVTPTVSRNIYCDDGSVHFPIVDVPVTGAARPKGTYTASPTFGLPTDMPIDVLCKFQFTNEYKVNPIRTITNTWTSEQFKLTQSTSEGEL